MNGHLPVRKFGSVLDFKHSSVLGRGHNEGFIYLRRAITAPGLKLDLGISLDSLILGRMAAE